jgi:hypothetical protein
MKKRVWFDFVGIELHFNMIGKESAVLNLIVAFKSDEKRLVKIWKVSSFKN